jgi:hypothetical protein
VREEAKRFISIFVVSPSLMENQIIFNCLDFQRFKGVFDRKRLHPQHKDELSVVFSKFFAAR